MLFSNPDYPIFLIAVFFLYALARGSSSARSRRDDRTDHRRADRRRARQPARQRTDGRGRSGSAWPCPRPTFDMPDRLSCRARRTPNHELQTTRWAARD